MRRSIHTASQTAPSIYSGSTDAIMQQPQPDPGETYPHVNTQLFGVIDPASNADLTNGPIAAPFNSPAEEQTPTNDVSSRTTSSTTG
ncbi:hypothetical protein [Microbacterium memoriense]|uniref:Uncharacterized protein n=1 Tax=Microbacterium memoriense TaxID=2978350 RepID=A0ABT2PEF4_9MICO|nr:hypothetical protein [Microbacterium memoriense]MCT9002189.1 hypothetical protein [Microbacterium memoriense]